jgi:DNA-binding MarR family transcriptional regulator
MSVLQAPRRELPPWTFLTNHAHVLIAISRDPDALQKDIAFVVGITTGRVQQIIGDLEAEGYLRSERVGRRNRYHVITDQPLRHPLEDQHTVHDLIASLRD